MQTLHWVDRDDPVVQTWPKDGFVVIRSISEDGMSYFTSTVRWWTQHGVRPLEIHVALIDDGTHYTDSKYYQQQNQEGLDIPSSYWLGAPARHEKRVPKKNRTNPAGGAARGQTKSGRRKSKARLDR